MSVLTRDSEKIVLGVGAIVGVFLIYKAYTTAKKIGNAPENAAKSLAAVAAKTYTATSEAIKNTFSLGMTPSETTVANIKARMPAAESIRGEALRDLEARRKAMMLENMSPLKLPATTITAFQAWWNEDKAAQEFFARKPDGVFYD